VSSIPPVSNKRIILSEIPLFDPLGLLGPTVIIAKLIMQDLWISGIHWDESLPQEIHTRWLRLRSKLIYLNQLNVPRCVKFHADSQAIQLHGFCDASQRAYGACIYIRTSFGDNDYRSNLLCSKSRVAPIKTISLPRLELSAALVLARLVAKVGGSIDFTNVQIFLWSDSTIILNWITSTSRKWSVFVANRVGEIQRLTNIKDWRHVASANNPADVLSRGLDPCELADSAMWWHGPEFLRLNQSRWPNSNFGLLGDDTPEQRGVVTLATTIESSIVEELLNKFSNLHKICRIIAYCMRISKGRRPTKLTILISPDEASAALRVICKAVQRRTFRSEYEKLSTSDALSSSSNLLSLSPFMDEAGIIRVGGRLKNSKLPFDILSSYNTVAT